MTADERPQGPGDVIGRVSRAAAFAVYGKVEEAVESMIDAGIEPSPEMIETIREQLVRHMVRSIEEKVNATRRRILESEAE